MQYAVNLSPRKQLIYHSLLNLCIGSFIASFLIALALTFPTFKKVFSDNSYSAILEEGLKYLFVLFLIITIKLKTSSIPFIGIGFGLLEVFARLQSSGHIYTKPFVAHIIFGLTMALFIYLAQKSKTPFKGLFYGLALIAPAMLHIFYNLIIAKL